MQYGLVIASVGAMHQYDSAIRHLIGCSGAEIIAENWMYLDEAQVVQLEIEGGHQHLLEGKVRVIVFKGRKITAMIKEESLSEVFLSMGDRAEKQIRILFQGLANIFA